MDAPLVTSIEVQASRITSYNVCYTKLLRLCISVPANPIDNQLNVLYHGKTVEALATKLGYEAYPIDEGLSVVYSELGDSNFTGVSYNFV